MDTIGGDESAKLWKVNRTMHEMVKDRVSPCSSLLEWFLTNGSNCRLSQGFLVSDDEINMDLATFKQLYAPNGGSVESVMILSFCLVFVGLMFLYSFLIAGINSISSRTISTTPPTTSLCSSPMKRALV